MSGAVMEQTDLFLHEQRWESKSGHSWAVIRTRQDEDGWRAGRELHCAGQWPDEDPASFSKRAYPSEDAAIRAEIPQILEWCDIHQMGAWEEEIVELRAWVVSLKGGQDAQ